MKYYFAPMEGITGYIFRNAHHEFFPGIDKYFTPFITPKQGKGFTSREKNDVLPEHNENIAVVPQILTNNADGFLAAAAMLRGLGYEEINLNLGCPSKTVVTKHKGAGFLALPRRLDEFLERIFEKTNLKISVKTRIGLEDPEEFGPLLQIFNKYPLTELIIHPRLQTDFYKNQPNMDCFERAVRESKNPVCYNGDLFSAEKIRSFQETYPSAPAVMLGRGLLVNPCLVESVREDQPAGRSGKPERVRAFHDRLVENYVGALACERDALFKMKELWSYMGCFCGCGERELKHIRKAQRLSDYMTAAEALFPRR